MELTLFHAALGLLAQAHCVLKPHKEDQFLKSEKIMSSTEIVSA
jgi:hypothetical protein